jgi:hypothetical protein
MYDNLIEIYILIIKEDKNEKGSYIKNEDHGDECK